MAIGYGKGIPEDSETSFKKHVFLWKEWFLRVVYKFGQEL